MSNVNLDARVQDCSEFRHKRHHKIAQQMQFALVTVLLLMRSHMDGIHHTWLSEELCIVSKTSRLVCIRIVIVVLQASDIAEVGRLAQASGRA